MNTTQLSSPCQTSSERQPSSLKEEYDALVKVAKEQNPGILDIIEIYHAQEATLQQSQEYFQLFQQVVMPSTSNSSQ